MSVGCAVTATRSPHKAAAVSCKDSTHHKGRAKDDEGSTPVYVFVYFFRLLSSRAPQTRKRLLILSLSVMPNSLCFNQRPAINECFQYLTTVPPSIECSVSCCGDALNFVTALLCFQTGVGSFPQGGGLRPEGGVVEGAWTELFLGWGGCMILFLFVVRVCVPPAHEYRNTKIMIDDG